MFSPRDIGNLMFWYDCEQSIRKNDKVYLLNLKKPITWWRKFQHKFLNWIEKDTIIVNSNSTDESIGYNKCLNKHEQSLIKKYLSSKYTI